MHAERPTDRWLAARAEHQRRKAPFPRILFEGSSSTLQRFGGDRPGASNARSRRASRRGGCAASRSMPLKAPPPERGSSRVCTDCSGRNVADKLAHRVEIQAPQPWLHPGTRHGGSPPLPGLAPKQQPLIHARDAEPAAAFSHRSQHAGAWCHSSATRPNRPTRLVRRPNCCQSGSSDTQALRWGKLRSSS